MEPDRTAATGEEEAISTPGPQAPGQSSRVDGHLVCPENWDPVGGSSPRDGLRPWHDLLAKAPRLAEGRRLEPSPSRLAQPLAGSRPDRLFPRGGGLGFRPRRFWGAQTGPNPTDRAQSGTKHP